MPPKDIDVIRALSNWLQAAEGARRTCENLAEFQTLIDEYHERFKRMLKDHVPAYGRS